MAPAVVYFKSLLWLIGLGGLGYGLLELTTPSKAQIESLKSKYSEPTNEDQRKKALFLQKLKEAASDTPVYLKDKKDSKN